MDPSLQARSRLREAKRIVIKFGTRSLVQKDGRPDTSHIASLVREIARWHREGREIVVVSSGAIGSGMEALGWSDRPKELPLLQLAAAVGQARLMTLYSRLFARLKIPVGQVLLTHDDLKNRVRHLNARNSMLALLRHRVIPIVNENDVVSVDEIKVGDNDQLAAMVSILVDADLLMLMTTAEGLLAPGPDGVMRRVPYLAKISGEARSWAVGKGSALSTGGMATKLQAAHKAAVSGTRVVIADGRRAESIGEVLSGLDSGTVIDPAAARGDAPHKRKLWIAFFNKPKGTLVVDEGARSAIVQKGRSLLPIGMSSVEGRFTAGDVVQVAGPDGLVFAHGLSEFSSEDARAACGLKSEELARRFPHAAREVIHRDNLALLDPA
jgi:glutamate 5-kinase